MFKSIFAKYVTAFMTIIIVSFAITAAITGMSAASYNNTIKENSTESAAVTIKEYIENDFVYMQSDELGVYIYMNHGNILDSLSLFTSYEDGLTVLIADKNGKVLISDRLADSQYIDMTLPENFISEAVEKGSSYGKSDLDGLFEKPLFYHTVTVRNNKSAVAGVVVALMEPYGANAFPVQLAKLIITTMLWVMFAALLIVYFMTNKITKPLKKISKAAKAFAAGDFSVKVEVNGNDEIAELAKTFNNMAESLENLEQMRSGFLANVSHDLRTPMTSISGFIDGMLDGAIPPEKYTYYLGIVSKEVKRLSRLVSSLLEMTKFEAGERKLSFSKFDICEMARQILISFEKKIDEKKLDIEFECDEDNMFVNADRDAIYQILYNICDNAVKFSFDKGKYRITIKGKENKVFVSVYNEGKGIAKEDLPYVFDRFYKSDKSRGMDKTGVGLGLYISKMIIDAHKQSIWVESISDKYCEFVFTLEKA